MRLLAIVDDNANQAFSLNMDLLTLLNSEVAALDNCLQVCFFNVGYLNRQMRSLCAWFYF
ncbi:hypothetical protein ACPV4B_01660 [Vibrio parahaemolyticus]